jgi:hypothetical protein
MQQEKSYDLVGKKLFIGLPAYDFKISVKLAISLAEFCVKAQSYGINVQMANVSGCSVVSRARNLVVQHFLESDCDHLLMIDADMTINADDIFRLLAFNQTRGIVAGVGVARKKEKVWFSALDKDENGNVLMDSMGLVKATRVGTGFIMIQRKVFEALKEQNPDWTYFDVSSEKDLTVFFDFKLDKEEGYMGEDFVFCDRAIQAGFDVWIDPTIKLGHMGLHEFTGCFGEDFLYPRLRPIDEKKEAA